MMQPFCEEIRNPLETASERWLRKSYDMDLTIAISESLTNRTRKWFDLAVREQHIR
jgi:hypothetical protein